MVRSRILLIFYFILFFCWISPLSLNFLPISTGQISSIVFLLYITHSLFFRSEGKTFLFFILIVTASNAYYSLLTTINANYDYSLSYLLVLHVIQYGSGAYFFSDLVKRDRISIDHITNFLCLTCVILSVSALLSYLFIDFRMFLANMLPQHGNVLPEEQMRVRGLSNGGAADHSMQIALCSIGLVYKYIVSESVSKKLLYLFAFSLALIGNVFIARTGFLVSTFILISGVLLFDKKRFQFICISLFSIGSACILILALLPLFDELTNGFFSEKTLPWFLSMFSIFTSGEVNSSNRELLSMLYIPHDLSVLLFGSGGFTYFLDSPRSDSGFIKFVFSFGVVATLAFVTYVLYVSFTLYRMRTINKVYALFSIFLFFALILCIKEPFLIKIGTVNVLFFSVFTIVNFNSKVLGKV